MPEITCRSCPNFVLTNVAQGECHFNPPTCFALGGQQGVTGAMGIFPPVKPDETWCAKHPDAWRKQAIQLATAMAQAMPDPQPHGEPEAPPPFPNGPRLIS